MNDLNELESLWDQILSHQAASVQAAFNSLSAEEKAAIVSHLKRMASETGWHPEQRKSARSALTILNEDID